MNHGAERGRQEEQRELVGSAWPRQGEHDVVQEDPGAREPCALWLAGLSCCVWRIRVCVLKVKHVWAEGGLLKVQA